MERLPVEELGFGISCIDTGLGRAGLAACYLMEHQGRLAMIETGTVHTVPAIKALINEKGYQFEQVDYVIITHVHLDHAGGAGALMQAFPNAKLVVHPRGARHMADPAKLQAGATAVYGEKKYQAQYGDLQPIPQARMIIAEDNDTLLLGDRELRFIDTPGHARHHFCVYDALSQGIFTGDTLGIVYRELCEGYGSFVMPSTTPVQFDPPALAESIDKLMALQPQRFFLTHYSMVEDTQLHADRLKKQVDDYVAIAIENRHSDDRQKTITHALMEYTLSALAAHGSPLTVAQQKPMLQMDMALNAQGLDVWLQQQQAQQ